MMIKHAVKKVLYGLDYFLLLFFGEMLLQRKGIQEIHFSMDDVFDLCINENNPICDDLRELYDSYGLLSHLYIFYQKGEITMVSISDKICSQENIDLAPHQAEYIDETYLLIDKCKRSEYVRLHGYKADKSQIDTLKRVGGVSRLLTAESKSRKSYDLTDEMIHILYDSGRIERNGISYIKTDVRLEKMILYQLLKMPKKPMLVIFTHENKFEMIKKRLHLLCRELADLDLKYI